MNNDGLLLRMRAVDQILDRHQPRDVLCNRFCGYCGDDTQSKEPRAVTCACPKCRGLGGHRA